MHVICTPCAVHLRIVSEAGPHPLRFAYSFAPPHLLRFAHSFAPQGTAGASCIAHRANAKVWRRKDWRMCTAGATQMVWMHLRSPAVQRCRGNATQRKSGME